MVRKIGAPYQPELAVAAVVDGDRPQIVRYEEMMRLCGVDDAYVEAEARRQLKGIERRWERYLRGRAPLPLAGCIVLAILVAPADTVVRLRAEVDALVCLSRPEFFHAVGMHYRDFHQIDDGEVAALLDASASAVQEP